MFYDNEDDVVLHLLGPVLWHWLGVSSR